ncbi:MAG: ABC transporter permease, partial [Nevskiaceae bacterium]
MTHVLDVIVDFLRGAGRATLFFMQVLAAVPVALTRLRLVWQQVYSVGVLSMVIIVVSGSFVGMVLA